MSISRDVDLIARWAKKLGYDPRIDRADSRRSVYIWCGHLKIRVSDHGDAHCNNAISISPHPMDAQTCDAVALLAQEAGKPVPAWVMRHFEAREEAHEKAQAYFSTIKATTDPAEALIYARKHWPDQYAAALHHPRKRDKLNRLRRKAKAAMERNP